MTFLTRSHYLSLIECDPTTLAEAQEALKNFRHTVKWTYASPGW